MNYSVIVPAAGQGVRLGHTLPKAFVSLSDGGVGESETARTETLRHSSALVSLAVRHFESDSRCELIIVCVPEEHVAAAQLELKWCQKVRLVMGGATRQRSVYNGALELTRLKHGEEGVIVLVHDAARCCIDGGTINRVVEAVVHYGAASAGLPVFDTLVRCENSEYGAIVNRDGVWCIQTPQGFLLSDLLEAHRVADREGIEALDDASLVARMRPVRMVVGDRRNLKVTTASDLEFMRAVEL